MRKILDMILLNLNPKDEHIPLCHKQQDINEVQAMVMDLESVTVYFEYHDE